ADACRAQVRTTTCGAKSGKATAAGIGASAAGADLRRGHTALPEPGARLPRRRPRRPHFDGFSYPLVLRPPGRPPRSTVHEKPSFLFLREEEEKKREEGKRLGNSPFRGPWTGVG